MMIHRRIIYLGILVFATLFWAETGQTQNNVSSGFCWVNQGSGSGGAEALDVSADLFDDVVAVGVFSGTVRFGGQTSFQSQGGQDGFIVKYNNDGDLIWAKVLVTGDEDVIPRAVENRGFIYITGYFKGTATFGPGDSNQTTLTSDDAEDVFVARYTSSGQLSWVRKFGGNGVDRAFDVKDNTIAGTFHDDLTGDGVDFNSKGAGDIFIINFTSSGAVEWAREIGGSGEDRGYGISSGDELFVCGEFSNTVTFGINESNETTLNSKGNTDIFLAKFDYFDGDLIWAKRAGGASVDRARDLSEFNSDNQNLFMTGFFIGPADFDGVTLQDIGGGDTFVACYRDNGDLQSVVQAGGPGFDQGNKVTSITLFSDGSNGGPQFSTALVTGEFQNSVVFGKGESTETTLNSNGGNDIYVAKYNQVGHLHWAKQIGGPQNDAVRGIGLVDYGYVQDPDVRDQLDLTEISNSFIAGSFQGRVEFGGVSPVTADGQDMFVTRLSDFIPPNNLTLDQVPNTPYLKVSWGAPVNELAPAISLSDISVSGQQSSISTIFRVTVQYESQIDGDDDVNQDAEVLVVPVQTAQGQEVRLRQGSESIGGNGASGQITFEVVASFGFEAFAPLDFAIKDAAGNVSNYIHASLSSPNNLAANLEQTIDYFSGITANEPGCNASINLLGYNVYRDSSNVITFLAFVPAHLTMFIDEFTTPNQAYTYRVTAVYEEGESEHTGNQDQAGSPGANGLFDRIQLDGFGQSSAAVWGDYDRDGDLDMFIANQLSQNNMLFRNDGGSLVRLTSGDPVSEAEFSYSASWADYDNDGWLDLFVANGFFAAGRNNFLYHNNNGVLTKVTSGPVVATAEKSTSGVWGDYNNDGWLDLFVTNNLLEPNALFQNNKDGTFTRVSSAPVTTDASNSYHADWVDYNDDGYLDLFVANNGTNEFYKNLGPSSNFAFQKLTTSDVGSWLNDSRVSRGSSWSDYDNDGDLDLFIANEGANNQLLRNNGSSFQVASVTGVNSDGGNSRGSSWGDFDNDGDQDLFVTNLGNNIADPANNNFFYFNQGNGNFTRLNQSGQIRGNLIFDEAAADGCSWGDFNNDGFLDIIITNGSNKGDGKNFLYQNNKQQGSNSNKSVTVHLIGNGRTSNKSALGARVHVRANVNGNNITQMQQISGQTGGGWGGQNSLDLEFGLGNASRIDELKIEWPSGQQLTRTNLAIPSTPLTFTENSPPVEENQIADQSLTFPGSAFVHNLNTNPRVFSDPDGDALTYTAQSGNNGFATASVSGSVLTVTPVGAGSTTITITANDGNGGTANSDFQVNVQAGTFSVAGRVFYVNGAQSSVANATVQAGGQSSASGSDGAYQLTLEAGNYTLTTAKTDGWGGVNSADALKILQHFVGTDIIPDDLRREAADVNNSNTINAADAQRILQRFVGIISSFNKPDWLFEDVAVSLGPNQSNINIPGIATGDVNVSFIPSITLAGDGVVKVGNSLSSLPGKHVLQATPLREFELPLRVTIKIELAALSLKLGYPMENLRFLGVSSPGARVNRELLYNVQDGMISIAWVDMTGGKNPLHLERHATLVVLRFEALQEFEGVRLSLLAGSELNDAAARTLVLTSIDIPEISAKLVPNAFALYQNYPNPFNPTTNIRYDLKSEADVHLAIYNILGELVATLVDKRQEAGAYDLEWNAAGLASGIYFYRIRINAQTEQFNRDRKLLLLK